MPHSDSMNRRAFITSLSRIWPFRLVLALALAGLVYLAVLALWHGRDLIAIATILVLGVVGLNAAVAILPLSDAVRARMAKRQELSERYPSYRYKVFLWLGLGTLAGKLWLASPGPFNFQDILVPLIFVLAGLVASLIWRFKHRGIAGGA